MVAQPCIKQPVAQTRIKAPAPQDLVLLDGTDSKYGVKSALASFVRQAEKFRLSRRVCWEHPLHIGRCPADNCAPTRLMVGISGSVMDTAGRADWVVLGMSEPPRAFQSTPHAGNRTSAAVERMRDRMVVLPLTPCHQTGASGPAATGSTTLPVSC